MSGNPTTGTPPWRFGTTDYLLAVERCASAAFNDPDAVMVEATWDAELGRTMSKHGLAVTEEAMLEMLVT